MVAEARSRANSAFLGYRRAVTEPQGTSTTPPARPYEPGAGLGRLVAGRYRLGAVLGVGGMAIVHRAQDIQLHRAVAIKLLRLEVAGDTDIAMRFRREALAATVLRHPNIVACLEAGADAGQPFLVMELVEGEDLAARLRRVGRLAPSEVVRIGLDVARGLSVAHARGIVHRDMKPGNILLARDGRAIITDFGIARLGTDPEAAVPGTTLGSVHYFSPEQAKGEGTTAASDVYGLGLVMYEALTGERAWSGDTTAALAAVRVGAPAPSPRAKRPEVPAALDAIVIRALDPDANRRYANGTEIAAALAPLIGPPGSVEPDAGPYHRGCGGCERGHPAAVRACVPAGSRATDGTTGRPAGFGSSPGPGSWSGSSFRRSPGSGHRGGVQRRPRATPPAQRRRPVARAGRCRRGRRGRALDRRPAAVCRLERRVPQEPLARADGSPHRPPDPEADSQTHAEADTQADPDARGCGPHRRRSVRSDLRPGVRPGRRNVRTGHVRTGAPARSREGLVDGQPGHQPDGPRPRRG